MRRRSHSVWSRLYATGCAGTVRDDSGKEACAVCGGRVGVVNLLCEPCGTT